MKKLFLTIICFAFGIFLLTGPLPVWADDVSITTSFDDVGGGDNAQQTGHDDKDPFKGWLNLTVQNTGTEAWGDFHFEIYQVPGQGSVANVDFIVSDEYEPTSSQSPLTWSVDNNVVGAKLDLYFYSDPVLSGETANFKIYTDNTVDKVFFGVLYYPTPVPVPSAMVLLGSGIVGLLGIRRKFRKALEK